MSDVSVVLVVGDVDGQFKLLFRKMNKLLSKLKNITMALCTGNFFGPNCEKEWDDVKFGTLKAPFQIYVLGPTSENLKQYYPDCTKMADLAERITFLGKAGTFRTAEGIKIAYFSGSFSRHETSDLHYNYDDINRVIKDSIKERPDFLMTWSWPNNFGEHSKMKLDTKHPEMSATYLLSFLAPQYHIAARERKLLELSLQRSYDDGSFAGNSRFIGLSYLIDSASIDWVKALNITPYRIDRSHENTLVNVVPLPFHGLKEFLLDKESVSRRTPEKRYVSRYRGKKVNKIDDLRCWFCLANPEVEKHMIIAIGDCTFLALAKGPLVDEHMLISSIQHSPSMRSADNETRDEIEKFKKALRDMHGKFIFPVFYERSFRSSHLQIHCIPIPLEKSENIVQSFMFLANEYQLNIDEYQNKPMCYMSLSEGEPYFHVDLSKGHELLISGNLENPFPLNFGREALIAESLLNRPDLKEWKNCKQSQNEESKLVNAMKKKFKRFDFT